MLEEELGLVEEEVDKVTVVLPPELERWAVVVWFM